jgi:hypothetical protein
MDPLPKLPSGLDWSALYQLRMQYEKDREMQNALAPLEHRLYAKEYVKANPGMMAPLKMGVMIPGYQALKWLQARMGKKEWSDPSWAQMMEGYRGIGEGME